MYDYLADKSMTENGAIGYKETGNALLDVLWQIPSMRKHIDWDLINAAYKEDSTLFYQFLFYLRDCREGVGERNSFRVLFAYFLQKDEKAIKLLSLIAEYGRWDDLIFIWNACSNNAVKNMCISIIRDQLQKDQDAMKVGKSISLLAKWMPSVNAGKNTSVLGKLLCAELGMSQSNYRKMLSSMRKYLGVVEIQTCANQWGEINYEAVPSQANLKYMAAFLRHDEERRREFLNKAISGEVKMNANVTFPHQIVAKYDCFRQKDDTLEALWNNLPNVINPNSKTICVCDTSDSMNCPLHGAKSITAMHVAAALSIYFADHLEGPFANRFITFSRRPQLIDLSRCQSLDEKLLTLYRSDWGMDTNIEAVFNLLLNTYREHPDIPIEQQPDNILIISDMEFNQCSCNPSAILFQEIARRFAEQGVKLPRLCFWNVNSRTNTVPIKQNDLGVALIGGYSLNLFEMVMNGELDPYKNLLKILGKSRYQVIREILQ